MEKIKDIDNPKEEFEKLTKKFKTLHDRFLAIAMDYTHYIDSTMSENEIFKLSDNILSRLYSARFHFQLLIEYLTVCLYYSDQITQFNQPQRHTGVIGT